MSGAPSEAERERGDGQGGETPPPEGRDRRRGGAEPAARDFLVALAQALSARRLYGTGHPRTGAAVEVAVRAADTLLDERRLPIFTFLGQEVIFGHAPLRESGPQGWAERLGRAGIQRIEVRGRPSLQQMLGFLEALEAVLRGEVEEGAEAAGSGGTLLFGSVRPREDRRGPAGAKKAREEVAPLAAGAPVPDLGRELEAITWIWREVEEGRPLPLAEAEGVVRSLSVLLRDLPPRTAPRVGAGETEGPGEVPGPWGYGPLHALHTALLAMAWTRDLGVTPRELLDFGMAGLFHDVGLVRSAPGGLLDHAGELDEASRAALEAHPLEGARVLMAAHARLALAAVVAFEHHLLPGGGGYPAMSRVGVPHPAARLIQLLSSYDALRSPRPHRAARSPGASREVIRSLAGRAFDADMVVDFERIEAEYPAQALEREATGPGRGREGGRDA